MSRLGGIGGHGARLAVFFVCLELAARIDDAVNYGAPLFSRYDYWTLLDRDDGGVPHNVPGARFEKWKINSLGFRGEEIPTAKAPGDRRIVCVGQSESFGLYEREGGEWPALLGRRLGAVRPGVRIVNASVVGAGRRSREAYLEKYVLPLRPDVILLVTNPYNEATAALQLAEMPGAQPPTVGGGGTIRAAQPRILRKLRLRLAEVVPERVVVAVRSWWLRRRVREAERTTLAGYPALDVLPEDAVASFEEHLRRVVRRVQRMGARPVVATYPTLVDSSNVARYGNHLENERVWNVRLSERGLIDAAGKLNAVSRRVAEDLAVPLFDAAAAVPRTTEFFADGVHYTDAGAERVAAAAYETLDRAGALGEPGPLTLREATSER